MRSIPPYSVQMRQKADQKNSKYEQTLHLFGLVEQTSVGFEKASFYCRKNEVFHQGFLQYARQKPQFPVDLVTFTEEILNRKCSKIFKLFDHFETLCIKGLK